MTPAPPRRSDSAILILLPLASVLLHAFFNGRYGFHRDELATVDDARHLAWGFVAYPPLTPFVARMALVLFGPSLVGLRLFSSLALAAAAVLTGWMARELGGRRFAQGVATFATLIAPLALLQGDLFQYVSFDYLWWVLAAYFMVRLLHSADPRWWLGVGAAIGLGMMTKYTMGVLAAGIAGAVVLTPARRYLRSPWLWAGAAFSVVLFLPNLFWQIQHNFISLDFLRSIHARDVQIGRASGFLAGQLLTSTQVSTIPVWLAGLYFFFAAPAGKPYRALGWMFAMALAIFLIGKGRDYYLAPAYPMLFAAGAVTIGGWIGGLTAPRARVLRGITWSVLAAGGALSVAALLPIAPVNSPWWNRVTSQFEDFHEEIGWPELVQTLASLRNALPPEDRVHAAILAGNYGEAGAVNLYGPAFGLPPAISGVNSFWLRGYGDPPPRTVIAVGFSRTFLERNFESCELVRRREIPYGVKNEESNDHRDLFVCRSLRQAWPDFWRRFRSYG